MNKSASIRIICAALSAISAFVLCGCSEGSSGRSDIVYEDMKEAFEKADLYSSNIGIMTKTAAGDSVSYGETGSGVIFETKDGMYYALTAAHVISHENSEFLVFTVNTEMATEEIPGIDNMHILKPEVYDAMYKAEVMYVSTEDDLAVIRFSADEKLSVIEMADADPKKEDRIMCVGNPENEWFAFSYGKVLSGIERVGEFTGFPSNAMKHSAYINVGSSGGAAVNEEMKLAGITPGASLSADGKKFNYGVMIPVSEITKCLSAWRNG